MLDWKKRADGTLIARRKKDVYQITDVPHRQFRFVRFVTLTVNNRPVATEDYVVTIPDFFEKTLPYETEQENYEAGKKVRNRLKKLALDPPKPPAAKKSSKKSLEEAAKFVRAEFARSRRELKAPRIVSDAGHASPQTKTPPDTPEYTGEAPEERVAKGMTLLFVPTEYDKCPFQPEDAKFSTLYKWGERVRDYFETRGKLATARFLIYAARNSFASFDRGDKAAQRVAAIYADESRHDRAVLDLMVERSNRPPDQAAEKKEEKPEKVKKKKVGKDSWGFRNHTDAHAINTVLTKEPKSDKTIKRESGVQRDVRTHLYTLVKKKKVKKLDDGKYRLRKGVKPCV